MQRVRGEWAFIALSLFKTTQGNLDRSRNAFAILLSRCQQWIWSKCRVFCCGGRGHWWSRRVIKGNSVAWMLQATASATGYG